MKTIGQRIKDRREDLGMSQDELARKVGYKSRSSINKIELDGRNLTQSKIKAIADALETTPGYIMGWEEQDAEDLLISQYITDPEIRRLVLFAGAKVPQGEARRKFVDAVIYASEIMTRTALQ